MVDVANRLRMAAMRPKPLDLVEGKFGACSNNQEVVFQARAVCEFEPVLFRMHARCRDRLEVDPALGEGALEVDFDCRTVCASSPQPTGSKGQNGISLPS